MLDCWKKDAESRPMPADAMKTILKCTTGVRRLSAGNLYDIKYLLTLFFRAVSMLMF